MVKVNPFWPAGLTETRTHATVSHAAPCCLQEEKKAARAKRFADPALLEEEAKYVLSAECCVAMYCCHNGLLV